MWLVLSPPPRSPSSQEGLWVWLMLSPPPRSPSSQEGSWAWLALFPLSGFSAIHGTVETRITTPQRAEARLVAWPVSLSPLTQYYTFGAISSDPAKSSAHALRDLWIDTQK